MLTQTDMLTTDSDTLATMAVGLRDDAKALQYVNRSEAMRLFRLWRRICAELKRRELSAIFVNCGLSYKLN